MSGKNKNSKNKPSGPRSGSNDGNHNQGGAGAPPPRQSPTSNKGKQQDFYRPYLDQDVVESGSYLTGVIRVNPKKKQEAYVSVEGVGVDIRIDDDKLRNRSLHGDIVAIELLPQEEWTEFSAMLKGKLDLDQQDSSSISSSSSNVELQGEDAEALRQMRNTLWRPMVPELREREAAMREKKAAESTTTGGGGGVSELEETSRRLQLQPRGRVVRIMEAKAVGSLVGGLQLQNMDVCKPGEKLPDSVHGLYFQPLDTKYPNLYVPRSSFPEQLSTDPHQAVKQIYLADMSDHWSARSRMPQAVNLRPVGQCGSIEAETEALLIMNSCHHGLFTEEVLGPLRERLGDFEGAEGSTANNWCIPQEEIARRRDLRGHRIFTIDPPNAKDLDDALHITPLNDGSGGFEIGVHIADVSYFIDQGSALDTEAKKRSTSVYLVQKVIPMLPAILCEQLCSLNPNVDRLAFSCIWQMNADGSLCENVKPWFGRTVIRSCAKLDYPTAQRMIDGEIPCKPSSGSDEDAFLSSLPESVWESWRRPPTRLPDGAPGHKAWRCAEDVKNMHQVAKQRRSKRLQNGSLVLTSCKLTFNLDPSTGNPAKADTYVIRESNQLVEEYMLLANYLVAQELILMFGDHAFLRSHDEPDTSGMKELQTVAGQLGLTLDTTSSKTVQDSLNEITRRSSPLVVKIITNMLTKPIPEASYRRAGEDPGRWKHYALAIPYYTHFTSPIRRYPDVIVHRLLDASIQVKKHGLESDEAKAIMEAVKDTGATAELDQCAGHCNEMKRASKNAQMRSDRVFLSVFLLPEHSGPQEVIGYVTGIGEKSFTVFVPEFGVDDRLFVDNMAWVTSSYDADKKEMTLTRSPDTTKPLSGRAAERPNTLAFTGTVSIGLLSCVKVLLSARQTAPVDVQITLIDLHVDGAVN
jgi:DIS3-like exonuclease 2